MATKRSRSDQQQQRFNWTYLQRKQWIDEAELPRGESYNGDGVSPQTMRAVLHLINDHLGDNPDSWPSRERIAGTVKIAAKTVTRATQALEKLSLLIVIKEDLPNGARRNRYRIVWSELQLLDAARRAAWRQILENRRGVEPGDMVSEPGDMVSEPGDMVSEPGDMVSEPGDMVSEPGDMVSEPGDMVSPKQLTNNSTNKPKNNPTTNPEQSSATSKRGEPDSWVVVEGVLIGVGMSERGTRKAVTVAQRRELTPANAIDLVERWERLRARQPHVTVAWLYRWLTGEVEPPPEGGERQSPRSTSLTSESTREEMVRSQVVRSRGLVGASEAEIAAAVREALAAKMPRPSPRSDSAMHNRRAELMKGFSSYQ